MLILGRIPARLLERDQDVAETRFIAGNGRSIHLFDNLIWAIVLPVICLPVGGLNYYLDSYNLLKWDALSTFVLRDTALSLAAYMVSLAIIGQLLVSRWEIRLVTICVCLTYFSDYIHRTGSSAGSG